MRPSSEHNCPRCGVALILRGAEIFTSVPCPACSEGIRIREEIGGYRLGEPLARSGLGMIFSATDSTGAPLAVKLLQPPRAAEIVNLEYFASEVWTLARLDHPHCLRIFAAGVEHGTAWIAMEWLAHGSLADRLATKGRLRESEVLALGIQAASALGAAHGAGLLHRDLEPNNIVFAEARTVKVTDFAQAALYQFAADDLRTVWGRTSYISPERLRSEPEEAYSDIYSLGAILFHALTGEQLHNGEPHGMVTIELLEDAQIGVEELASSLHEKTAFVVNRMLKPEPGERFQNWSEVVTQLTQAGALVARRDAPSAAARPVVSAPKAPEKKTPPQIRPRSLAWVVAALLLLGVVIGVVVSRHDAASRRATPASVK